LPGRARMAAVCHTGGRRYRVNDLQHGEITASVPQGTRGCHPHLQSALFGVVPGDCDRRVGCCGRISLAHFHKPETTATVQWLPLPV
jgi:hypothetical protein